MIARPTNDMTLRVKHCKTSQLDEKETHSRLLPPTIVYSSHLDPLTTLDSDHPRLRIPDRYARIHSTVTIDTIDPLLTIRD